METITGHPFSHPKISTSSLWITSTKSNLCLELLCNTQCNSYRNPPFSGFQNSLVEPNLVPLQLRKEYCGTVELTEAVHSSPKIFFHMIEVLWQKPFLFLERKFCGKTMVFKLLLPGVVFRNRETNWTQYSVLNTCLGCEKNDTEALFMVIYHPCSRDTLGCKFRLPHYYLMKVFYYLGPYW